MKSKTYHLNIRASNDWSKDDSKFGQRMLEKMGWKKGQGLGLNHQGISENVKLRVKLNTKGLGFKQKDDELLQIGSSFTELLNKLQNTDNDINDETNTSSPISLEQRSENLKSRLHYHRFTRGKDLSQYDKKSLSEILGFSVNDGFGVEENDFKLTRKAKTQLIENDYNAEIVNKSTFAAGGSEIKPVGKKQKRNVKAVSSDTEIELPICNSRTKKTKKPKNTMLETVDTAEQVNNYEEYSKDLISNMNNLCKSNDNLSCHWLINDAKMEGKNNKKCNLNDEPDSNVTFTSRVMLEQVQLTNFDQNNGEIKKNRGFNRTKLVDFIDSVNDEKPVYYDVNVNNKENLVDEFTGNSKRRKKKPAVNTESTSENTEIPIDDVYNGEIVSDKIDGKEKETYNENNMINGKSCYSQFNGVNDKKKGGTEREELGRIRNVAEGTIDDSDDTMKAVNSNSNNVTFGKKTHKKKYKNSNKINDASVSSINDNAKQNICEQSNERDGKHTVSVNKRKETTKDDSRIVCNGKRLKTSDIVLNNKRDDGRGDFENVAGANYADVESEDVSAYNCESSKSNESPNSVRIIFDQYERHHNVQLMIAQRSQEQYTEMKQHNDDKIADNKIALRLKNFEEKMELLEKIRTSSVQINFSGSNIMDIKGYGISANKQR